MGHSRLHPQEDEIERGYFRLRFVSDVNGEIIKVYFGGQARFYPKKDEVIYI